MRKGDARPVFGNMHRGPWLWILGGLALAAVVWVLSGGHVFLLLLLLPLGFGLFRRREP